MHHLDATSAPVSMHSTDEVSPAGTLPQGAIDPSSELFTGVIARQSLGGSSFQSHGRDAAEARPQQGTSHSPGLRSRLIDSVSPEECDLGDG